MNEEKILKAAKKIIKRRLARMVRHMICNIIRLIMALFKGSVTLLVGMLGIYFGSENGVYDITIFCFIFVPLAIMIVREDIKKYFPKKNQKKAKRVF